MAKLRKCNPFSGQWSTADNYTYHFELLQLLHAVACRQYLFTTFQMAHRPFCAGTERLRSWTRAWAPGLPSWLPGYSNPKTGRQTTNRLLSRDESYDDHAGWLWTWRRLLLPPLQAPVFPKFPAKLWIWNHQGHGVPTAVFNHRYLDLKATMRNHNHFYWYWYMQHVLIFKS